MAGKKTKSMVHNSELESLKLEQMRIRFRRVLGEAVSPHVMKMARKKVAGCVRTMSDSKMREKDA